MRLRAVLVPTDGPARGSAVLSPGRTEPIEKYFEVAGELQARGFAVLIHDWRGQGLSGRMLPDALRGHAVGWKPFLADHSALLSAYEGRLPKPWIAMGHSMGGGLTALALAEGETRFAGAVLSAPMLGVNLGRLPAGVASALAGGLSLLGREGELVRETPDPLHDRFEANVLTHDRARWERSMAQITACPELRLGGVTWGWVAFALALQARTAAPGAAERITVPLTVVAAAEEKLVLNAAGKRFAERAPHGRWLEVPGAYHEILMETDDKRAVFWAEFDRLADAVA